MKNSQRTIMTGHPEFYINFAPDLDKFNVIVPNRAHKTTLIKKQLQTLRFEGITHLVRTQNFRKTYISYALIRIGTCAYKVIRNVGFAYVLNE